ncbi:hypothetical protein [Ramlibacter tataouinensis]|uniref:Uncharacterized protein n=1 Tax=Ramlibacter tataouinensis (strain ATCC BAA-407 / DSM 14655 / LMG 21543 / TTB310) TaxID=365046 RepID=F5Y4A9_RAMTT|nr:hypothetical protein [Ramlibacter tataouinensis]AEG92574.1 hypothetical protein Rta_14830 [Ramlibacter tataouinensis TTB310]
MKLLRLVFGGALGLAASQAALATCYTVYGPNSQVLYQAQTPPVDMSRPLHETLPRAYPGGHLVFDSANQCPVENVAGQPSALKAAVARAGGSTPLLTDRGTAEALGLPHTPLGNDVVVVPQRPANMRPGLNVMEGPGGAVVTEAYAPPVPGAGRTVMGGAPAR